MSMLKTKRKKTLLENNHRLAPIDEGLIKGKDKLYKSEESN